MGQEEESAAVAAAEKAGRRAVNHSAELIVRTPQGGVRNVPLSDAACRIGRASDNDLAFPEQQELSRHHLVFEPGPDGWTVRDLGSRNGTLLNWAVLREPTLLRSGDLLRAGMLQIEFQQPHPAPARVRPHATADSTIAVRLDRLLSTTTGDAAPPPMPLTSARHLHALLHAGVELTGRLPLSQLLPLILDLAADAVDAPRGALLLEENGTLSEKAARGGSFPLSTSVRERVLLGRESLLIQDMENEGEMRIQASIVAQGIRSMIAVPLQTNERVLGLLYLDSAGQARPFLREDLNLLTVMANMAAASIENTRLAEVEERERRVSIEMEQAAAVQRLLLPGAPPSIDGLDIAAFTQPCRHAGGDYYDFFRLAGGRLAVVVGDVAGKGMPAALLMASLQARFQVLIEAEPNPAQLVERLNRVTSTCCPGNRFITLFYCLIDPASGGIHYVNAGHNPPLILRRLGKAERLETGGLPLGVFPDSRYHAGLGRLEPGDVLALYSDGVTEAARPETEDEFGEDRLVEAVLAAASQSAVQILECVRAAVGRHAGGISAGDDFTLVIVRRTAAA